ncbi:MAG: beta strand repeat-containing protein, partial [Roseimicrobium sp.]
GAQDSGLSARSINSAVMVLNANQNVIQQSANQAIDLLANDATLTAALSGNLLLNSGGHGILATSDFGISRLFLRATGNTIDVTGKDGMSLQAPTGLPGSALTARLVGNQITNTGLAGVNVLGADDHVLDIQLSGNIVDKTATHGVYLKNQNGGVLTANLDGNSISNTGDAAVYLDDNGGKSTLLLADGNILDNAMNSAVLIYAQSTANVTATFTNNHISKSDGDGIELLGRGTSQITFLAADNTITGNAVEAIGAGLEDSATGVFEIVSNSLLGNAAAQLYFRAEDTATLGLTARGNQISDGTDGASVADILNNATASLVYEDNVILNQMYGIQVLGNANTQATVTGNEITNTLSYGIDVRDTQTVTISRNTIAGIGAVNSEYGIHARAGVGGVLEISNNTVVGGGGVGISVTGGDSSTSTIKSNTIKENLGGGIVVETNDAVSAVFEIVGNQLDDNHQHAIAAYSNDTSSADVTVSGNFINTTFFGSGIHLEALDTSTMTGMALNNFIDDSDRSGVFLISRNGATAHFTVTGNTATQTNNSAIQTFSSGTSIMTANIQNNSLLGTRGNVIYVESLDTSNQKVTIAGNTVVGSDFVGLTVNGLFNSTLNVVWDNNSISDVARLGGSAIWVREASGTTTLDSNVNNVVVPNTNAGLLLESDGNVSGTIILNGAPVVLPATIP